MKISPKILEDKAASAITPRTFLKRMLSNLSAIYLTTSNPEMCFRIQQYLRCAQCLVARRASAPLRTSRVSRCEAGGCGG